MVIVEAEFDNEAELETWAFANLNHFLGECVSLGKLQVSTASGKKGVPDGFAFNFSEQEWYVIECELLRHGVWPHIAEQVSRFAVALQNRETLRVIRDRVFEELLKSNNAAIFASQLGTTSERLLQRLELFIEGVQPSIVVFIDDANQDLNDFAHALDVPTSIYRIKKFIVNGKAEYYSPDRASPVISATPNEPAIKGAQDFDVVEQLGGGIPVVGERGTTCYKLTDGTMIHVKRSKYHERNDYYWYGLNPKTLEQIKLLGATHIVFVLGDWGFVNVPIALVETFLPHTRSSNNPDGSVRHYHLLISPEPEPALFWSVDGPKQLLTDLSQPFVA